MLRNNTQSAGRVVCGPVDDGHDRSRYPFFLDPCPTRRSAAKHKWTSCAHAEHCGIIFTCQQRGRNFSPSGAIPVSWERKHVSSRIDAEGVREAPRSGQKSCSSRSQRKSPGRFSLSTYSYVPLSSCMSSSSRVVCTLLHAVELHTPIAAIRQSSLLHLREVAA